MVRFVQFSYYKTANHTTPCSAVRCTIIYSVVQLCYFVGGFGTVFTVCAVLRVIK